jgi:hypothetical protein
MRLSDLERIAGGTMPRIVARVPGAEEYELIVTGSRAPLERMLADATIDVTIGDAAEKQWTQELATAQGDLRESMWSTTGLDDLDHLFKPEPAPLQKKSAVIAAIRPVERQGTPFAISISGFTVPAGVSFVFFGLWVASTFGRLTPATGDQDLFLHLFTPSGPVVSASLFGGTTTDTVAFGSPFFPFVPVFQVRGFATGVCASFLAFGV